MSRSGIALFGVLALVSPSTVDAPDQQVVPNSPPTVVIEAPLDGGFAQPGEPLPFKVTVTDDADAVDCTKVVVTGGARVGPDCTGVLTPEEDVRTFSAQYTDTGELTGAAEVTLNPREQLAPDQVYPDQQLAPVPGFVVPHVNLAGINHIAAELAGPGGIMTVHADAPEGPVVATFPAAPAADFQWLAADVVDPVGVHDLYFVGDGVSARYLRFQTIPKVTAAVPPAPTGWYTTDVPVTVSTAPLWDAQVSLDGGATWAPSPVVLSAEGAHDVRYRAVDVAGRATETLATAVRIDRTAPVVPVTREHPHSTTLELAATDAGSGVATFAATLDGAPVTGPVELWRYPAGAHQLTVTATDVAGNTATQATELEITTSLAELTPLMTRFPIPFVKSVILRLQLMSAQHAVDEGRTGEAVAWVRAFLRSASVLRDPVARATLTADAGTVVTQLLA